MNKRILSIYVPWYEEQRIQTDELKPCESLTKIEFDGCCVTIRLDCDAGEFDCIDCPVRPGFKNLRQIRW